MLLTEVFILVYFFIKNVFIFIGIAVYILFLKNTNAVCGEYQRVCN